MDVIRERIKQIIEEETDIPKDEMGNNDALLDDLDLSSLEVLTVFGKLEDIYSIEIGERDMRNIVTIEDVVECIFRKINK